MFCNYCGKELQASEGLCPHCGETTVPTNSQPVQQEAQPPVQPLQPTPVPAVAPKKKSKLPIIIVAIVLIAAIIAGAILIPGMLKKDSEGKGEEQEAPKPPVEISCITSVDFETMMNMEMSMDIEYNENGYPSRVYMLANGEAAESRAVYNEENYTYTTETYERGILVEKTVSECDEKWNDKKAITYVDDVETSYTLYEYNDAGELSKETVYENGAEKESTVYEYDTNNNLIKEAIVKNGAEVDTIVNTYDANGNITKKTHSYEDGIKTEHVYTYDETGLCDKIVYYEDGAEAGYDMFTYNEKGEVISRDTYMMGMKVITTKVTYTVVKVDANHAEAIAEKQTELLQVITFFS